MKTLVVTLMMLGGFSARAANVVESTGTGSVVQICAPKMMSCTAGCKKPRTKIVERVVEKRVEVPVDRIVEKQVIVEKTVVRKVSRKNSVNLLVGYGALGNLRETPEKVYTENGPVVGLQYMRVLRESNKSQLNGLIQVQTNRTLSLGVGLGF